MDKVKLKAKCSKCLQEKVVVEFFFAPLCATGLYRLCKSCLGDLLSILKNELPENKEIISDELALPSETFKNGLKPDFTYVVWFNR